MKASQHHEITSTYKQEISFLLEKWEESPKPNIGQTLSVLVSMIP